MFSKGEGKRSLACRRNRSGNGPRSRTARERTVGRFGAGCIVTILPPIGSGASRNTVGVGNRAKAILLGARGCELRLRSIRLERRELPRDLPSDRFARVWRLLRDGRVDSSPSPSFR